MAASPEENRKVIEDYYAAYGSGDMGKVADFFADDIEWHIPGHHPLAGTKKGKAEVAAFFAELGKSNFRAELVGADGRRELGGRHASRLVEPRG